MTYSSIVFTEQTLPGDKYSCILTGKIDSNMNLKGVLNDCPNKEDITYSNNECSANMNYKGSVIDINILPKEPYNTSITVITDNREKAIELLGKLQEKLSMETLEE